MKRFAAGLLALLLLGALPKGNAQAAAEPPEVAAGGAALREMDSCRMLAGWNEHVKLPMASTTKIMTALLAIERCELDRVVKIPDAAVGVEGSSMYLAKGEELRVIDLLYGLMLTSGNDAAVALAIEIAGSEEDFARLMNERAEELGCTETNFVTPNGLHDPEHYTTAYDLCRIACAAMRSETFRTIVSTEYYQTQSGDKTRTLKNKNKILWQYDGGNGVKTGFTKAAGRCLVFSAERGGTQLVGVVLKCPGMWDEAKKLLDFGFDNYRTRRLIEAGLRVGFVAVRGGEKKGLELSAKNDILYPLSVDGTDTLRWTLESPDEVAAPVQAGTELGRLKLYCNDEMVYDTALYAAETVEAAAYRFYIDEILERFRAG